MSTIALRKNERSCLVFLTAKLLQGHKRDRELNLREAYHPATHPQNF